MRVAASITATIFNFLFFFFLTQLKLSFLFVVLFSLFYAALLYTEIKLKEKRWRCSNANHFFAAQMKTATNNQQQQKNVQQ